MKIYKKNLSITQINTFKQFEVTFLRVLNMHAPLKQKLLRENHSQYVTKALRKAIMKKYILRNKLVNPLKPTRSIKIIPASFIKKEKKFFDNLYTSIVSDNKTLWKVIKPFFTNKGSFGRNIKLIEKE